MAEEGSLLVPRLALAVLKRRRLASANAWRLDGKAKRSRLLGVRQ